MCRGRARLSSTAASASSASCRRRRRRVRGDPDDLPYPDYRSIYRIPDYCRWCQLCQLCHHYRSIYRTPLRKLVSVDQSLVDSSRAGGASASASAVVNRTRNKSVAAKVHARNARVVPHASRFRQLIGAATQRAARSRATRSEQNAQIYRNQHVQARATEEAQHERRVGRTVAAPRVSTQRTRRHTRCVSAVTPSSARRRPSQRT